jgi:hypothetical protein
MKYTINAIFAMLILSAVLQAQETRKVLVEIFTNSHCPLCPPAHNTLDNYLENSPNADRINYIFFHMEYPYPTDLLYQQSKDGSDARDNYYDPVQATPQGWFDGTHQGPTSGWATSLDNLVATQSPFKIVLSGHTELNQIIINADVTRTGTVTDNDLIIHFVVAENVYYAGGNGISNHKQVMRKMFPSPSGLPFTIELNEMKSFQQPIDPDPIWFLDSLRIVVFIQSINSKIVYQSETINYNDLTPVKVNDETKIPLNFNLEQNFPNPFNPATTIRFTISPARTKFYAGGDLRFTILKVYDVLGNEVATLVNEESAIGGAGNYEVVFNASSLPSGVYFYQLRSGNYIKTKKMILLQ